MSFRNSNYRSVSVYLAVSLLVIVWFVPICFAIGPTESNDALSRAESDLGSVYVSLAKAERAGANVTILLNKLSQAGNFLSEAYTMFRAGNYQNAVSLAESCSSTVEGVAEDAAKLRFSAERLNNDRLFLTVAGSGVGLIFLFVLGFFGWNFLKKWYAKRVLNSKPVVEEKM